MYSNVDMDDIVVQRRTGRPNRGGGRRGRRGGRRGRGGGRGSGEGGEGGHGRGGRRSTEPSGSGQAKPFHAFHTQGPGQYGAHQTGYADDQASFVPKVKVPMQKLQMTSENQEMVRDMLRDLRGGEQTIADEDGYNELDVRTEDHYWMEDNQLVIEEIAPFAIESFSANIVPREECGEVNPYSVQKLIRYGFNKEQCIEALFLYEGDIGTALEYLISESVGLPMNQDHKENNSQDELDIIQDISHEDDNHANVPWEDILEQRNDEMIALQSIYEDKFIERISNRVWVLKLNFPVLENYVSSNFSKNSKKDKKAYSIDSNERTDICKFFMKGSCRFGKKCKNKHVDSTPNDSSVAFGLESQEDQANENFELEIRFPKDNKYPFEMPILAFSTSLYFFPKHLCLKITKYMLKEAQSLAKLCEPVIFHVISGLEDQNVIQQIFGSESPINDPKPEELWRRKKLSANDDKKLPEAICNDDINDVSHDVSRMMTFVDQDVHYKERSLKESGENMPVGNGTRRGKDDWSRQTNPAEKLRQNKTLKEEYKNKQNSSKYKSMQVNRQNLPAWDKQKDILKLIHDNQVVVISGMTGCGKTTQIPQFILDSSLKTSGLDVCNILCTQPRRISAIAVAERVAEERAEKLGRIIGYKIRLEKVHSTFTRLLYCTNGIILRQLEGDPELQGVTHLILDEVHERSEESDFLLMYLRDLLPKRPDLKIILMSATLNVDLFSEYFYYCPVLDIPGRAFPVDQFFLEDIIEFTKFVIEENSPFARPLKDMNALHQAKYSEGTSTETCRVATKDENLSPKQLYERYSDYSKTTSRVLSVMDLDKINFDLIVELLMWIAEGNHEYPKEGAILIFMPGFAEIQTLFEMLQTHEMFGRKNRGSYRIIPLHSTLSSEDQHAVFARPPKDVRKIVISTNIAETSITIDDVVFVIDSGKMKEKSYDACKGMESLNVVWVSKANALQRKGRAGRVTSGICFHLFTSHRYNYHLQPQPVPGIRRVPLEQIVLRIKMLDILKSNDAEQVLNNLPEPPDPDSISSASKRLQDLGALDEKSELTPLGFHLGTLPVDVRIGKLMLFGAIFRCLDSALTIAASLSFKSPFVSPFGKKNEADKKRLEFAAGYSDHLTVVNAYKGWIEAKKKGPYEASKFCHESFLSQKSFQMLASMKQQFVVLLSDIDFIHKKISARDLERAARSGGDGVVMETGPEANINSDNWRIVSAILVGALYPNIVQIMTPATKFSQSSSGAVHKAPKPEELKFKTKVDGYVYIHPSSVNFQVRYYESPYLVYHEKVKTSKVYLRDCTMVSVYPLLLFGGGAVSVDLDRGNFILSVDDGWIRFVAASHQIAELVRELRLELDQLLSDKIENPNMDLCTCPRGSRIIETIVKLISSQ